MKLLEKSFSLAATDLSNHLSCRHLTNLSTLVARGDLKDPSYRDPSLEILFQRGRDHEAAYVAHLNKEGLDTINLDGKPESETIKAMKKGYDVMVQPTLQEGKWMGRADILLKVATPSDLGNWSYEVQDTKLSQNTKAGTILQLCLYSELVGNIQGVAPKQLHVVTPGDPFSTESYSFADFRAYYNLVKQSFETFMEKIPPTYPDPVEHCGICRWWQVCDKKRHEDDHLSLVAGIQSLHIEELKSQKIDTLEQFAEAKTIEKPKRGNKETFKKKQDQAKIQLAGRHQNQLLHQLLPIEPGRGLNRLPEPNKGDIYFDIEGDNFYKDGGLEYILGYAYKNEKGVLVYKNHWATNRAEEKRAFEAFIGFVTDRWKHHSKMYIYHFAPYEQTAIKRLARIHAIFEKEVDDLLRAERFIDLHAITKESLIASVESYSLKALEKYTQYTRKVDLHDASVARKAVEVALELNDFKSLAKETIQTTQDYNEDDCLATQALHQWLENIRTSLMKDEQIFERPELKTGEASENVEQQDTRSAALFRSLTKDLPEDRSIWTEEQKAKWLLANQIDYFRREDKSAWWEFFRVHELGHEELLDERKAIAGLEFEKELPKTGRDRNPTHRYRYPPQEISIDEDDEVIEVKGEKIGTVKSISLDGYTIDIKKSGKRIDVHPSAIHVSERVDPGSLATSIMDFALAVDEYGLEHSWPQFCAKDLLMKRSPVLIKGAKGLEPEQGEKIEDIAIRIALSLDRSVLAIQGPPGSGKTYTGARMMTALSKAGKKIGITAVSHKVIRNLMQEVIALGKGDRSIQFVHKVTNKSEKLPEAIEEVTDSKKALSAIDEGKIVGGTAWLWADKKSEETLDYLIVDEAGQMSLSHVLAASRAALNLILLGDPQQLEQPQKGTHPEGSDVAALTYLLDGHATMPEGKGLFLEFTRRLHPDICRFTSEIFYDGKLKSLPGLEKQVIGGGTSFDGAGLFCSPVDHTGNQSKSDEEVQAVVNIVGDLLKKGTWTNAKSETLPLTEYDILIVAPYNAQVSALLERLPGMRVGTVDKFQGQQAPVVIYSMTSSSQADAPRGMGFLYSLNRLNVATSRARCICILVASPKLMEPECRTIEQMRLANGLCRYLELAATVTP